MSMLRTISRSAHPAAWERRRMFRLTRRIGQRAERKGGKVSGKMFGIFRRLRESLGL